MPSSPTHRAEKPARSPDFAHRKWCRYCAGAAAVGALSLGQLLAPGAAYATGSDTTEQTSPQRQEEPAKATPVATDAAADPSAAETEKPGSAGEKSTPAPTETPESTAPVEEPTAETAENSQTAEEPTAETPAETAAPEPTNDPSETSEPSEPSDPTVPTDKPVDSPPAPPTENESAPAPVKRETRAAEAETPAPAAEPVGDLRIVLDDYAVDGGDRVTGNLAGVDTASADPVTVTATGPVVNADGQESTTTVNCTTNGFSDPAAVSCAVPTDAKPGSSWTVTGTQGDRTASTSFTIDGEADEQQIESVDIVQYDDFVVEGSDWDPGKTVTITLTGPDGQTVTMAATPDADGNFSVAAPSDLSHTPGVWTATATNSDGDQASTTFTVTAYEANPALNVCGILPIKVGETGEVPFDISGYYPNEQVVVSARTPYGNTVGQTVTTDDEGNASGAFTADSTAGIWTISANQSAPVDSAQDLSAWGACTVIAVPPIEPPGGGPGDPGEPGEPGEPPVDPPVGGDDGDEDDPPVTPPDGSDENQDEDATEPPVVIPPPPTCATDPTLCPVVLPGGDTDGPKVDNAGQASETDPPVIEEPGIVTIGDSDDTDGPTIAPTPPPSATPSPAPQAPSRSGTPESEKRESVLGCDDNDGISEASDFDRDDDGYCDNEIVNSQLAAADQADSAWDKMWIGGLALWSMLMVAGWWFLIGKRRADDAES